MSFSKRLFDILFAVFLAVILAPVIIVVSALIAVKDGYPIFYISERMGQNGKPFGLVKFRTMKTVEHDTGVSGGDKTDRITAMGKVLRKRRLDEVPQLINILKGDMSFVGPRPPLRQYVERFPELYSAVLVSRPGVTGLATLMFHAHEERLISGCASPEETDAVYARRCVPRKAELDLIYQRSQTVCFDLRLLFLTLSNVLKR